MPPRWNDNPVFLGRHNARPANPLLREPRQQLPRSAEAVAARRPVVVAGRPSEAIVLRFLVLDRPLDPHHSGMATPAPMPLILRVPTAFRRPPSGRPSTDYDV